MPRGVRGTEMRTRNEGCDTGDGLWMRLGVHRDTLYFRSVWHGVGVYVSVYV